MAEANPGQPAGTLSFEAGLAQLKAKMTEGKTNIEDAVLPAETEETAEVETPVEAAQEENTEAVSTDESEAAKEPEADNRPVLLPDGSEITVEEARKGYLRQADWTRKTQEIARMRENLVAEKQVELKKVSDLHQQLSQLQEQEPNWLELARDPNTDPKQLQAAQLYWQHKKSVMERAQQEIAVSNARQLQTQKAQAFQALTESKLEPTWSDPKKLKADLDVISNYWIDSGLPGEMLDGIANATIIEMIEKARRHDQLVASKPKATLAVKGKPAPVKPGARSTASPQAETVRVMDERFRKNPTQANAVALMKAKAALG